MANLDLRYRVGLEVVAEGVEDNDTLTRPALLGCDRAQGFHFAGPMAVDELARFLEQVRARPEEVSPRPQP